MRYYKVCLYVLMLIVVIEINGEQYGVTSSPRKKREMYEESLTKRISILPNSQLNKIKVFTVGKFGFEIRNHSEFNITSISYLVAIDNDLANASFEEISAKRDDYNEFISTNTLLATYKVQKQAFPNEKGDVFFFEDQNCTINFEEVWAPSYYKGKLKEVIVTVRLVEAKGIKRKK